jgi:thermitase
MPKLRIPAAPPTHAVRPEKFLWRIVAPLYVLALTMFTGPTVALAQGPPTWLADELLVGFHAGVSEVEAEQVYRAHGAAKIERLRALNVHRIRVVPSALDAVERALGGRPEVKFVERNHLLLADMATTDPLYPSQWHLPKIGAAEAWDITQGSAEIVIAIVDTGVDGSHPDLSSNLVPGYNFYDNNTNTSDVGGHGTKVAGAAAAVGNNATGVAGVSWDSRIMPIRVADPSGVAYTSTIANALTWAADHGARVMNVSFSPVASSSTITSAAQYVRNKGGVVVSAAGNCGCWEAINENPYLLSVSATDSSDNLTSWSSQGNYVDLSAPGLGILTTTSGGGYASVSGTSFSSPITAGVLALMMAANPSLTPTQLETLLEANADDLGAAGWDPSFGYGRVNAYRAVAAAATSIPVADTTPPTATITSPATGSTLTGTVTVAVAASDNTTVARVDLYIDGAFYGSDTTSPYGFAWNTSTTTNGPHTVTANAVDGAGNVGTSATVTVTVNNLLDTTAPTVAITSTSMSNNKLFVSVSATDNVAVAKVELYVDGKLVGTKTAAPYTYAVNLNSLAPGTHTVQAKAYDNVGNTSLSAPVSFTKAASNGRK